MCGFCYGTAVGRTGFGWKLRSGDFAVVVDGGHIEKVHIELVVTSMEAGWRQGQRWGFILSVPWSRWEQAG